MISTYFYELYSTLNKKNKSVEASTTASVSYSNGDFILVNRSGSEISTANVGSFSKNGLFTFSEDMTALVIANISGKTVSENRAWINLIRASDSYKYDSSIEYGTYVTCSMHKIIKIKKGEQIALALVGGFNMNSGGFTSNMAVIRLD